MADLKEIGKQAKAARYILAGLDTNTKNKALFTAAECLEADAADILAENFLPKVLGDQMEFFRITDRAELAPGYQHILEPPGQTKRFLPDASIPTLLTAPGLAFDRSGARIGYGKGFYDRYLGKIPTADRPYLVGLCFSCQLFERLDGQKPHDINMDLIVTERR